MVEILIGVTLLFSIGGIYYITANECTKACQKRKVALIIGVIENSPFNIVDSNYLLRLLNSIKKNLPQDEYTKLFATLSGRKTRDGKEE